LSGKPRNVRELTKVREIAMGIIVGENSSFELPGSEQTEKLSIVYLKFGATSLFWRLFRALPCPSKRILFSFLSKFEHFAGMLIVYW